MKTNRNDYILFALVGGIFGGLIAVIALWIFKPETNSVFLFLALRVMIGVTIAMIVVPVSKKRRREFFTLK